MTYESIQSFLVTALIITTVVWIAFGLFLPFTDETDGDEL